MMANTPSSNVEHDPVGTQKTGGNEAFEWRRERYEEMGFSGPEAIALASSTEVAFTGGKDNTKRLEWRTPLSWQKVKTALDNGCSKTQALEIFLTV
jgi:hypothetical protein